MKINIEEAAQIVAERAIQNLRDNGVFIGRWIPVSEGLPKERIEVLTCSNGGFIEIQSLEESYGGYWENQNGDWSNVEVIAWMSLPEPYKAESEDDECKSC